MANTVTKITKKGNLYLNGNLDEVTYNSNSLTDNKNLLSYSQNFTSSGFWTTNMTVTPNSIIAPDGTLTGTLLTGTGLYPNLRKYRNQLNGLFVTPEQVYTHSIYVKAGNQNNCNMEVEGGISNYYAGFDLAAGTVAYQGISNIASITPAGSGWFRCSITYTIPATNLVNSNPINLSPYIRIGNYDGTDYTGKTIYIWGAQLEVGPTATVYEPTGEPKNLLIRTEDLETSSYFEDNCVVSANVAFAPDGVSKTAEAVISTINGGFNNCFIRQYQYDSIPINTNFTYSVHLKKGTSPTSLVDFYTANPYGEVRAVVNWTTSPATVQFNTNGATLLASSFTSVGNEWYRVSLSMSSGPGSGGSTTQMECRVYVRDQGSSNVAGEYVYIWGEQLELGTVMNPYVKNSGGTFKINPLSTKTARKVDSSGSIYIKDIFDEVTYNANSNITFKNLLVGGNTNNMGYTSPWFSYCSGGVTNNITFNTTDIPAPDGSYTATITITPASPACGFGAGWGFGYDKPQGAIFFQVGQTYTVSVWARTNSGTQSFYLAGNDYTNILVTATTSWQRFTNTFTITGANYALFGANYLGRGIQFYTSTPNAVMYYWGAQCELGSVATDYQAIGSANTLLTPAFTQKLTAKGTNYVTSNFDEVTGIVPVTSGLQLYLDPMMTESYTGSGSTWLDMSTKGYVATPVNTTFDNYNYALVYNGSASANTTYQQPTYGSTDSFTWNVWFKPTRNAVEVIIGNRYANDGTNTLLFAKLTTSGMEFYTSNGQQGFSAPATLNVWQNVCIVKNGTSLSYYRNNVLINSNPSVSGTITTTNPFFVGYSAEPFIGSISVVHVYNRALSTQEITQIYNTYRVRFGI